VISCGGASRRLGGFRSPGDYAALEFPPDPRHDHPVSYQLDLLRHVLLGFHQLPLSLDVAVTFGLPVLCVLAAARSMRTILRRR
jgi:hypothetical protein